MSGLTLTATSLAGMLLGCAAVGVVSQVAVGRARTDAAADLAALAVATRVARGEPDGAACSVGAVVATAHGDGASGTRTTLAVCEVRAGDVVVVVTTQVRVLGVELPVSSRARAGPVPPGLTVDPGAPGP